MGQSPFLENVESRENSRSFSTVFDRLPGLHLFISRQEPAPFFCPDPQLRPDDDYLKHGKVKLAKH